jgi:hypothetical protein
VQAEALVPETGSKPDLVSHCQLQARPPFFPKLPARRCYVEAVQEQQGWSYRREQPVAFSSSCLEVAIGEKGLGCPKKL